MSSWQECHASTIALAIFYHSRQYSRLSLRLQGGQRYPCVNSEGHSFLKILTVLCQKTAIINTRIHDDPAVIGTSWRTWCGAPPAQPDAAIWCSLLDYKVLQAEIGLISTIFISNTKHGIWSRVGLWQKLDKGKTNYCLGCWPPCQELWQPLAQRE